MSRLFASEKGFIFTMAGAAIGLGNIWRFPYLVANYGGGLFLLLYLLTLVGIGYFLLLGELSFGKTTRLNVCDGTRIIAKEEKSSHQSFWSKFIGGTSLTTAFMMNIAYLIAMGWILFYVIQNFLYLSDISSNPITTKTFSELTTSYPKQLFWIFVCLLSAAWLFSKGTIKQIERIATLFIPASFFILIYLIFWSLTQDGAIEGAKSVFKPDWVAIGVTDQGFDFKQFIRVLFAVISQVLYSLSIGMGVAYIYGTCVTKETNVVSSARYIIVLDTLFSILAAVFVLSVSRAYDIPKDVGFNLTFVSLPVAFEQMIGGSFVMFLFYGVLYMAAFTSLVSHFVPLIFFLNDKYRISKNTAFALLATVEFLLVAVVLLSISEKTHLTILGFNLFDFVNLATDSMLLISVFAMSLFIGWIGFKPIYHKIDKEFNEALPQTSAEYTKTIFRFIAPFVLILVLLNLFVHF